MKGSMQKMIYLKKENNQDYENAGNLYKIEITTESFEDYSEAYQLLLALQEIQRERDHIKIYGN